MPNKKAAHARRADPLLSGSRQSLRLRRVRLGLTIADLAARAGCGTTTVSRCEASNELPTHKSLRSAYVAVLWGSK